jgi:hypothetical protein
VGLLQGDSSIFWFIAAVAGRQYDNDVYDDVKNTLHVKSSRIIEVASRATVLVSMTALQQQPRVSLSLPLSLPLAEAPQLIIITHSSANSNLLVHSLMIAGEEGMIWAGDLHQLHLVEVRASSVLWLLVLFCVP